MPLFTFIPVRADGASTALEIVELDGDPEAMAHGRRILAEHASAAEVAVWQGDREVGVVVSRMEDAN